MNVVAAPYGTSPIILVAVFSVQILRYSGSYFLAMNSATSPIISSNTYDFVMHASGLAVLLTYPFNTLFILYTLSIHRVYTDPYNSNSFTICTIICEITLKKLGGMWIYSIGIVIATSFLKLGMSLGSITLVQILLKTCDNIIISI